MPWKITNTVLDPSKAMLQRRAARMHTDPLVCGQILRVRNSITVSDVAFERDEERLRMLEGQGVISIMELGAEGKKPAHEPEKSEDLEPDLEPEIEPEIEPTPEKEEAPALSPDLESEIKPETVPEPPATEEPAPDSVPTPFKKGKRKKKGKE